MGLKRKITQKWLASVTPKTKPYEVYDTEIPGFFVRVQPSGKMTFYVRYRLEGGRRARQRRMVVSSSKKASVEQARERAKAILSSATLGHDPAGSRRKLKDIPTLRVFLEKDYAPWVRVSRKSGAATLARIESLLAQFMTTRMDELTPRQVEAWQAARRKAGSKAATVNRELAMLKALLNKAVEWGRLEHNPIARVKRLKEDEQPRVRYLTAEELQRLDAALDAREERIRAERDSHIVWQRDRNYLPSPSLRGVAFADYLKPMVLLSLHTGLRRGELFSLTWEDINLELNFLTVGGAVAKSGNTRHVPLNTLVQDVLRGWHAQSSRTGLVFTGKDGYRFDNVKTAWEGVLDEAKIKGVTWHTMRHTFASNLVMAGVDLYTVQKLLGHSSIRITERYSHLSPAVRLAAVEALVPRTAGNVVPFEERKRENSSAT